MYDELVKRIHRQAVYLPEKFSKNAELLDVLMKAADAIEELSRENESLAKSVNEASEILHKRWIPVTERLPEDLTRVIVFCEDGVSYGLCEHLIADDEEVVEWHDFLHYPITPTHWMPLPEPPKEE